MTPIIGTHRDTDTTVVHKRTEHKAGRQAREHWLPEYVSHNETIKTYPSILLVTTVYLSIRILECDSFSYYVKWCKSLQYTSTVVIVSQ